MRILIDTHVLLWTISEPHKLPASSRAKLESADNEVLFSAVSIWELTLKIASGRLQLEVELEEIVEAAEKLGFIELAVNAAHVVRTKSLLPYHRDPFDRLLVAQAVHEPARLMTADPALDRFSDLVDLIY